MSSNRPRVGIVRGATVKPTTVHHDVADQLPASINTLNDLAAQRKRYFEEGYEEGHREGLANGYAQVEAETAQWKEDCQLAVEALMQAARALRNQEATTLQEVIDQTATLSLLLAESILDKAIGDMADPGREAIARVIGQLPDEGDVRIRLNSQDIETLGNIDDLLLGRQAQFIADDTLRPGSAIVQSQASTVDGSLDKAIERARQQQR